MTRLLVSVRSAAEAIAAVSAGAELIDVKEPTRGPLGPADSAVVSAVITAVARRVPVSAAVGELVDTPPPPPAGVSFAKCGLRGAAPDWPNCWRAWRDTLPATCRAVAVAYAECEAVGCPNVPEVMELATETGWLLVDTALKDGRTLLDHLPVDRLARLLAQARSRNIRVALAGALSAREIVHIAPLRPDIIAVRGAACDAGRQGRLNPAKVGELARLVNAARPPCPPQPGRVPSRLDWEGVT